MEKKIHVDFDVIEYQKLSQEKKLEVLMKNFDSARYPPEKDCIFCNGNGTSFTRRSPVENWKMGSLCICVQHEKKSGGTTISLG